MVNGSRSMKNKMAASRKKLYVSRHTTFLTYFLVLVHCTISENIAVITDLPDFSVILKLNFIRMILNQNRNSFNFGISDNHFALNQSCKGMTKVFPL